VGKTMRRIAFINEKGGSCKTTLAVNTAAYLAGLGQRILLVDVDPQGQSGKSLGFYVRDLRPTVFDVMMDDTLPASAAIRASHIEGLDVLPANKHLADFPTDAAALADREHRLAAKLDTLTEYDAILFDSPPSLGLLHTNILLATEEIVVPVNLTYFALDGCAEIVETIETVRERFNKPRLEIIQLA